MRPNTTSGNGQRNASRYLAGVIAALLVGVNPIHAADDDFAGAVDRDEPSLSLSINAPANGQVFRGWPMLIRLELWHPRIGNSKAAPLILAAKDGPWSGAVTLQVTGAGGKAETWPIHLATTAGKSLTLAATRGGELIWWLAPEQTAKIPEGEFRLLATLDTTRSSTKDAWKGKTASEPLAIQILPLPAAMTPEQQLAGMFLTANYHLIRKDASRALQAIDDVLKRQPANIRGLAFKADLLAAAGKPKEALTHYQQAIDAYRKTHPRAKEPPVFLLDKQKALLDKLILDK